MKKGVLLRVDAIGLVAMLFSGMSLNAENLIKINTDKNRNINSFEPQIIVGKPSF